MLDGCQTGFCRFGHKGEIVAIAGNQMEIQMIGNISYIRCVQTPLFRAPDGWISVVRLLQSSAIHTRHASSASRRPLDMSITGGDKLIKFMDYIWKTVTENLE